MKEPDFTASSRSWRVVTYEGSAPFKKAHVRDEALLRKILKHLREQDYIVLLGPPYSEKTALLHDVAEALRATGLSHPIYIDLWQAITDDETTFFDSLARLIAQGFDGPAPAITPHPQRARAFQDYLEECLAAFGRHTTLIFDHLHPVPDDLIHSLLLVLRSVYTERDLHEAPQWTVVVAGGINLADFSTGPTSPFNIAKAVRIEPLDGEQSRELAHRTLQWYDRNVSKGALAEILRWAEGDRHFLPLLCNWSAEAVAGYQRPTITSAVVRRAVKRLWLTDEAQAPIREAIRLIEEDAGTLLDVLQILDDGKLAKRASHQSITRSGTTRLELCGAVVLANGTYRIKNEIYRAALTGHFRPERVGHVLRMTGRWREAIAYLAPRLGTEPPNAARGGLLEAVIQSIYAADGFREAYRGLVQGLELSFGLKDVSVYRANVARNELQLVYARPGAPQAPRTISFDDPDAAEAQAFRYSDYALRRCGAEFYLVATLNAQQRPIGVVRVDHYAPAIGQRGIPRSLPELKHFLRHAATAIDDVMVRSAYQEIGRAVLDARTAQPTLERVLTTVADALGADYGALYLVNEDRAWLEMKAGVGWAADPVWAVQGRFQRASAHPGAKCLDQLRIVSVNAEASQLPRGAVSRFSLQQHFSVFLPLLAAGDELGTLMLGFDRRFKPALREQEHRDLVAFADQVAVAVHNVRLLQRTDATMVRRATEMEKLRDINLALSSTLDLETVLARVVQHVQALFPGTEATIWEYHADTQDLTLLHSTITDPSYRSQRLDMESPAGQAVFLGTIRTVPAFDRLPDIPLRDHGQRLGWCSMMAIPLVSRDRSLGAQALGAQRLGTIDIYMRAPDCVPPEAESLLTAFAAQAAVAIDNARRYLELEQARYQLQQARERDISDLTTSLFHRIRNLVGDVPYQLEKIRERAGVGSGIGSGIDHINQRMNSLKALSESLRTLVDLPDAFEEWVDVSSLAEAVIHKSVADRDIDWEVSRPTEAVWVRGSRALLDDALQSLVENACEATAGRGTLRVHIARPGDDKVEIRVMDDGPGIPPEIQGRILELGFSTKTNPERERGRGLFTCKAIVQRHRGTLTFDSRPGSDTTFVIVLPAGIPGEDFEELDELPR